MVSLRIFQNPNPARILDRSTSIFLLLLHPVSLLSTTPPLLSFISKAYNLHTKSPQDPKNLLQELTQHVNQFITLESAFVVTSYLLLLLMMLSLIHMNRLTSIESLARMGSSWKALTVLARLSVTLLSAHYLLMAAASVAAFITMIDGGLVVFAMGVSTAIIGLLIYLYLGMSWTMGLVISLTDDGFRSPEAMVGVGELIRRRKMQRSLLVFLMVSVLNAVIGVYYTKNASVRIEIAVNYAIGMALMNINWLLNVSNLAAYAILCCYCEKNYLEVDVCGEWVAETADYVDSGLP
ncbi:hypothetical protein QJS04_geneDACA013827 [Acorus gramineus]|uniref:Uncharacterized protein n=1 Tax=Acorus gramineus TaxID=55184 RepID=A0AAV9AUJ4_ACOGR|nr:hypothetical protein QJS04_geneDACA013827 [Acorus gramineus]